MRSLTVVATLSITGTLVALALTGLALYTRSAAVMSCAVVSGLGGGLTRAIALVNRARQAARSA